MQTSKNVLLVILSLVVLVGLVVAMYLGSFWIFADSTKRNAEIRRDTFGYQQATINQATAKATEIKEIDTQIAFVTPEQVTVLTAQRRAIVNDTCELIGQVNGTIPPVLVTFTQKECS